MPIFEKPTYARYVPAYVGSPTEEVKALATKKEQDYFQNMDRIDLAQAALANLDINPIHEGVRKNLQDLVSNTLKSTVEKGDYENAGLLSRRLATTVATNPDLNTALKFQQDFKTWEKDEKDKLQNRTSDPMTYAVAKNETLKGMTDKTVDPITGAPTVFNGVPATKYFDFDTFIRGIQRGINPELTNNGMRAVMNPNNSDEILYWVDNKNETVTPEKVRDALQGALNSNPDAQEYLKTMIKYAEMNGKTETASELVKKIVDPYVNSFAYNRDLSEYSKGNLEDLINRKYTISKSDGTTEESNFDMSNFGVDMSNYVTKLPIDSDQVNSYIESLNEKPGDIKTQVNDLLGGLGDALKTVPNSLLPKNQQIPSSINKTKKEKSFSEDGRKFFDAVALNDKRSTTMITDQYGGDKDAFLNSPDAAKIVKEYADVYGTRKVMLQKVEPGSLGLLDANLRKTLKNDYNTSEGAYVDDIRIEKDYINTFTQQRFLEFDPDKGTIGDEVKAYDKVSDEFVASQKDKDVKPEFLGIVTSENPLLSKLPVDIRNNFVNAVMIRSSTGQVYLMERNSADTKTITHQRSAILNDLYTAGYTVPELSNTVEVNPTYNSNSRKVTVKFVPNRETPNGSDGTWFFKGTNPTGGQEELSLDSFNGNEGTIINFYLRLK